MTKTPRYYRDQADYLVRQKLQNAEVDLGLQDYLRVLRENPDVDVAFSVGGVWCETHDKKVSVLFDLTTGAPATEADAKAFLELLGSEVSE
jgi:hypothetical protein